MPHKTPQDGVIRHFCCIISRTSVRSECSQVFAHHAPHRALATQTSISPFLSTASHPAHSRHATRTPAQETPRPDARHPVSPALLHPHREGYLSWRDTTAFTNSAAPLPWRGGSRAISEPPGFSRAGRLTWRFVSEIGRAHV